MGVDIGGPCFGKLRGYWGLTSRFRVQPVQIYGLCLRLSVYRLRFRFGAEQHSSELRA